MISDKKGSIVKAMKMIQYFVLVACLTIVGCDVVHQKGEILSLNMTSSYEFMALAKTTNSEVIPISFTCYPNSTNHIYADVGPNEPMWYEGNKYVEFAGFEWINVHIRPDYQVKMKLEKSE